MLKKIKTLLGRQQDASTANNANSNFVVDKDQIISLLKAVAVHRLVCVLELPQVVAKEETTDDDVDDNAALSSPNTAPVLKFSSYIYKVGAERGAIEKLTNVEQHVKLVAAEQFKVLIDMHGTPLTFQIKVKAVQSEGEKEYYIFDLPEKVYYPLDRESRRLKVTGTKIPVYIKFPIIDKTLPSMLDDIGPKGMSLILSTKGVNLPTIKKRDVFKSCGINSSFGNGTFDLEVIEAKEFDSKSIVRLNCSYVDLSKDVQAIVEGIIGSLEQVTFIKPKKK